MSKPDPIAQEAHGIGLRPTAVIVKEGAGPKVLAALAVMGLLAEVVEQ